MKFKLEPVRIRYLTSMVLALVSTVVVVGCKHAGDQAETDRRAMILSTRGKGSSDRTEWWPQAFPVDPFLAFRERHIPTYELPRLVSQIVDQPANEGTEYWTKIINDSRYSDYHRSLAVRQLFARYLKTGDPLGKIGSHLRISKLCNEYSLQNATVFASLPFQLPVSQSAWRFQPEFMRRVTQSVYLRVSNSGLWPRDVLELIKSGSTNTEVRVLEIAYYPRD